VKAVRKSIGDYLDVDLLCYYIALAASCGACPVSDEKAPALTGARSRAHMCAFTRAQAGYGLTCAPLRAGASARRLGVGENQTSEKSDSYCKLTRIESNIDSHVLRV